MLLPVAFHYLTTSLVVPSGAGGGVKRRRGERRGGGRGAEGVSRPKNEGNSPLLHFIYN